MKTANILQIYLHGFVMPFFSSLSSVSRDHRQGRLSPRAAPHGQAVPAGQPDHCTASPLPISGPAGDRKLPKTALMSWNKWDPGGAGVIQCLCCWGTGECLCNESSSLIQVLPSHFIHAGYPCPWANCRSWWGWGGWHSSCEATAPLSPAQWRFPLNAKAKSIPFTWS